MIKKYFEDRFCRLCDGCAGDYVRDLIYVSAIFATVLGIVLFTVGTIVTLILAPKPPLIMMAIGILMCVPAALIDYAAFKEKNSNHN